MIMLFKAIFTSISNEVIEIFEFEATHLEDASEKMDNEYYNNGQYKFKKRFKDGKMYEVRINPSIIAKIQIEIKQ